MRLPASRRRIVHCRSIRIRDLGIHEALLEFTEPRTMTGLVGITWNGRKMTDPDHPILNQPWRWEIEKFTWQFGHDSVQAALDVGFVRDGQRRTLRFIEPQDVTIEFGGKHPIQCGEMAILDIRRRQLDGLTVQVTEFGASGTPLKLYARSVQEIDS